MEIKPDEHGGLSLINAVRHAYDQGQTDYSMEPLIRVDLTGAPVGRIQKGDAVIFCCRRGEREIELTEAFTDPDFSHFEREQLKDLDFVILTLYHDKFKDLPVAFTPARVTTTLGELIGQAGLSQLRCSESEKFSHITFFLNGGNNQPYPGEIDIRIPSPKGIPFETVPELKLPEVADEVIRGIQSGYDCIITNFANGDVIGHTANKLAKLKCAEVVDYHLGRVIKLAIDLGYVVMITADHGNLEELFTEEGKPNVSHTTNRVPFILIDPLATEPLTPADGSLQDVAPTILQILGIPQPDVMTGKPLVSGHAWGTHRRVLLIILDGWGEGKADETNPIHLASTPVWDALLKKHAGSHLKTAGESVGLQEDKAGNSEAGHLNIGAGRVVPQDDVRLDLAMKDGSFSKNEVFLSAMDKNIKNHSNLHLIGLLTEKSSHGSMYYPLELLKMAKEKGLQNVFLHLIFDGRSTEPGSAPALLEKLDNMMKVIGSGLIVTAVGRGIALDRDGNYEKIKQAYHALVMGIGVHYS